MKFFRYFFVPVFVVLLAACGKSSISNGDGGLSVNEARKQMEANPDNVEMKINFADAVLFEQQQLKPKRKDIKLLESVQSMVQKYISDYPDTWKWSLADARLYFQMASYRNAKGSFLKASELSQTGIEIFSDLHTKYQGNLEVRAYRAINLMNLPAIFEQEESINEDFEFLLKSAMNASMRSKMSSYEKGLLKFVFEGGRSYYKKSNPLRGRIEEALEALNS